MMLRIDCQAAWLVMICLLTGGCAADQVLLAVPSPVLSDQAGERDTTPPGALPEIDGSIQAQEWQDAEIWSLEGGGQLYLLTAGDDLFLAVRAQPQGMIVGNVFLSADKEIKVLHSSAALGSVVFQQTDAGWQRIKGFEWCCRSRVDDQSSREVRMALYDREGWLGANSFLGTENELEYKIRLDGSEFSLAVNYLWADGSEAKQVWPEGLSDGVSWPSEAGFPEVMEFSLGKWHPLRATTGETPPP